MKGEISTEHTVWCCRARRGDLPFTAASTVGHPHGCVSHYQTSGSKLVAAAEAREAGWTYTRDFGWLCPPCAVAHSSWVVDNLS
jgi:hypothetical protein